MDSGKIVHQMNPEIPAINLTATHKIKHLHDELRPKSLDLSKVIRLLEDPLTTNLTERHLLVLKKLLRRNQTGFLLRDLADLSHILNICAEKVNDEPRYASVLCGALEICRFPFLKERASDELIYAQDVAEFLSDMARLMRVPHAEVQQSLLQTVKSFFSSDAPTHLPEDLRPTSPVYRLQLLERSDLPKTLLLSMAALHNRASIRLQLLQTLQLLSGSSDLSCASILEAGGAQTVCLHMNEAERCRRVLLCSSEILWNLLESGGGREAAAQLGSMACAASLKEAFPLELQATSLSSDLQLRNHLLVIAALVAESPDCPLVESLFAKQLLDSITFPEVNSSSAQKLFHSSEELKTRKLLLNLLVPMSRNVAALQLFREEQVMVNLLQLVRPLVASPEHVPGSPGCSPPRQQEELQLQALDTLAAIAPLMLRDYMSCQGNTYLLLLLDWCTHKDGSVRRSRAAQTQRCLRVLRSVTAAGEAAVSRDLCDQGAIHQLLGVLILTEASCDEDDVAAVEVMTSIQLILSALCEADLHNKELFGSQGVETVVRFLQRGPEKFYSGLGHNKLLISTVDCVWSCVVGCSITEGHFLARGGASLLLDLLAASPRGVRGVVLATLLELCSSPDARGKILGWRDAGGRSAPGVLLQIWREEEEELGVARSRGGGIKDAKKPLLSRVQEDSSGSSLPANAPSAAVLETCENLRAKIYLLLCSLGVQELPGLSAGDQVTLGIVRRYLDFKAAEVWREMGSELILDGVKPIGSDREALRSICEASEATARRTMEQQARLLEEQQQQEIREEALVYAEMKTHRTQQQLAAKSWDTFVSRTSDYSILKEEKAQRMKAVESEVKLEAPADRPAKRFLGHILAVENTGDPGPAGVNVTLARTSI